MKKSLTSEAPRTNFDDFKKKPSHFWVYSQKNWKQDRKVTSAHVYSKQHYSQQIREGSNANVNWQING